MTEKCTLCLAYCPPKLVEDAALRHVIDKVFYFKIFRAPNEPSLICDTCRETVDGFYEYAEQVWKNQIFQRNVSVPSSSKGEGGVKRERDDAEERKFEAVEYLETVVEDGEDGDSEQVNVDVKGEREWMFKDNDGNGRQDGFNEPASEGEMEDEADESMDNDWDQEEMDESEDDDEPAEEGSEKKPKICKSTGAPRKIRDTGPMSPLEVEILQHYKLACDLCAKPLGNFNELLRHFKYTHNEPGYIKCCDKKITKKCWMVEHLQLHLYPDSFHCNICNKNYSSSRVLREHNREVHTPQEERSIKCETCHKGFATVRALGAHMLVAHGSFPCAECGKVLASQGSLKKHMVAMHGGGEQHVCDVCARVFRSKPCFEKHVKIHLGTFENEKVQCSMCSAWLTNKYCLRQHIRRVHTVSEVPIACEICGREQRNQAALKIHMDRAHNEGRFECSFCQKRFRRPHHMKEHVAIHHTGEEIYGCDYCPARFNTKNKQCLHRKTVHPVEFEAEMQRRLLKE